MRKKTIQDSQNSNSERKSNVPVELLHGLEPDDYQDYENRWRNSTYVLDQIKKAIQRRIDSLEIDKDGDYSVPNWPYLRADKNGQLKQLRDLIRLLP